MALNQITSSEKKKSNSPLETFATIMNMGSNIIGGVKDIKGMMGKDALLKYSGGTVPGKAAVAGDSKKNDTVNTKLSPGELVVPRSAMRSAAKAKDFVIQHFNKGGKAKNYAEGGEVTPTPTPTPEPEKKKKKEGNWLIRWLMGSPEAKGVMDNEEVNSWRTKER